MESNDNDKYYIPLISIGISFFNEEKNLIFAIQSVINQTYQNWELILVDDASTDNSLKIANSFKDQRIRVLESDLQNKGLVFRLNQLVECAKGKYFVRMDADDIMFANRIEKQLNFLQQNESIDLLGTFAYSIDQKNNLLGKRGEKIPDDLNLEKILKNNIFIHPTIMGKKNWFLSNKYDSKMYRMEDLELWTRTFQSSVFFNLEEPLIFYREPIKSFLKKSLSTNSGLRSLYIICFKNNKLRFWPFLILYFTSIAKYFLYNLFVIFRIENWFIRNKSSLLGPIEHNFAITELKKAIKIK